jgi:hypothetical protein
MKHVVFWDVTPCEYCRNRRFRGTKCLHLATQFLVNSNVVLSSLILSILKMETIPSSETSALTRATLRKISEDGARH